MGNIVAIVGRPNVGKSTLFNRLIERKEAITDPTAGTTRDRHYGLAEWTGVHFSVIDTGGYVTGSDDVFEAEIRRQVHLAVEEADAIFFLVDVRSGLTHMDEAIADLLRRSSKPVFVVANKVDTGDQLADAAELYALGMGEVYTISAQNGSGTGELLDALVASIPAQRDPDLPEIPRIAIVGRPNVGKSSLVNALLGRDQHIVTAVAGTTRDPVHSRYNVFGFDVMLLDTAGIRKKNKVEENIEFYSVMRSIRAIEQSDVCVLMIDATEGVQHQDLEIFSIVLKNGKGVVVLVNKWDLVEKDTHTAKSFEAHVRDRLAPFDDVPVIFVSVKDRQRIHKAMELVMQVHQDRRRRIPTRKLNEVMLPEIERNGPPMQKGKVIRIKYVTQLPTVVPSFAFFCNLPQYVKDPYIRFLENKLRQHFRFTGVPIRVFLRKK
ncbi:MAG: ribosome biogenesis GTPase Der [Flavobacteriales bacterium]|nr:ribosome biogenesis GTPase Der [Flavobacteriales bacterium]MCB9170442.1 ribosome biogenesis GTPase Der [Flavobacteriales bacterium]